MPKIRSDKLWESANVDDNELKQWNYFDKLRQQNKPNSEDGNNKRLTKQMEVVKDEKTNATDITKSCILKTNTTHRNNKVNKLIPVKTVQKHMYIVSNRISKFTKLKNSQ